ncbi:MAG: enoyl-CoA hydratase [Hyphomicrobiaceae bacterium]|jgi:enoyl-CoA hydratase
MDLETVLRTVIEPPIGWLVVDRPDARGAMTRDMWLAVPEKLAQLAAHPDVRVVVVRGSQGYFIAGADITEFQHYRSDPELARIYDEGSQATLEALERLAVPSIAMIDGPCVGGGSLIAFGCDLRVIADRGFMAIPAGRLGLAYPHHGLERLVAVLGEAKALDLLLTGRRIAGPESLSLGMTQRCFPHADLETETRTLCDQIAKMAPLSLRYSRLAARRKLSGILGDDEIHEMIGACFASDDYKEGVTAFLEKRSPKFKGS